MNVLVTGGAGFIGRHLVKELLKDHEVWVLDNLFRGKEENLKEFRGENLHVTIGSVADQKALDKLFSVKFDAVLHLASTCDVQLSIDHPEETFEHDIEGTFRILQTTHAKCPDALFLFMSSCMVYGKADKPLTEDSPLKASSPYAAAKIAGEMLTLSYHQAYGMKAFVLRPFNTFGPFGFVHKDRGEAGVILKFLRANANKQSLKVFGSGEQTRDFLYVDDCVAFILAALRKPPIGKIVHAGSGTEISINDLAKRIGGEVAHVAHHHPQSEVLRLLADNARAERLLGWTPKVSLDEGIRRTKEWIAENAWALE